MRVDPITRLPLPPTSATCWLATGENAGRQVNPWKQDKCLLPRVPPPSAARAGRAG